MDELKRVEQIGKQVARKVLTWEQAEQVVDGQYRELLDYAQEEEGRRLEEQEQEEIHRYSYKLSTAGTRDWILGRVTLETIGKRGKRYGDWLDTYASGVVNAARTQAKLTGDTKLTAKCDACPTGWGGIG